MNKTERRKTWFQIGSFRSTSSYSIGPYSDPVNFGPGPLCKPSIIYYSDLNSDIRRKRLKAGPCGRFQRNQALPSLQRLVGLKTHIQVNVLRGADMPISAGGGIQNFRHIFIASLQGVASEGARLALGVVTQSSTLYIHHIYIERTCTQSPFFQSLPYECTKYKQIN